MHIDSVLIDSNDPEAQLAFYSGILGFETVEMNGSKGVEIGESRLFFRQGSGHEVYHFAFQICTAHLEGAMELLSERDIDLLPYQGEPIIHFDHGRSIYFFDADGNIAEFIERPLVAPPASGKFDASKVVRLNEIGCPVKEPKHFSEELMEESGIRPLAPSTFSDVFCWVGDHDGVVIVTKEGRHWLPTTIEGGKVSFELRYRVGDGDQRILTIDNGRLS